VLKRRDQSELNDTKHWYLDKYQNVLVQRNVLALVALLALAGCIIAVFAVYSLAPLKSVEPYLLKIDEKSGVVQKVEPVTRNSYAANESIDRYFIAKYVMARESYNPSILRYNYNMVRVMSAPETFYMFRNMADPNNPESPAAILKSVGVRDVKFTSISYIQNPPMGNEKEEVTPTKIIQARFIATDRMPNANATPVHYVATIAFEYAILNLNDEEQLINPLGFTVTSYQVQKELN
jgi:type IV secretion system protein VirB8